MAAIVEETETIDISMINESWHDALKNFNFKKINDKINATTSPIYPPREKIFRALNKVRPQDVRVVIIGQDPYHGAGQATGYCFGFKGDKIPPSLKNIKNELENDLGIELTDYTLRKWAKQGVLLLNTSLTVEEAKPNSHSAAWFGFADKIVNHLNFHYENIVFVAWGAHAYNILINIDEEAHHLIVSSHPSPLSAKKSFKHFPTFVSSKPFSKINEYLKEKGKNVINF